MINHVKIFYSKKLLGYMLMCRNAERVHVQRKVGKPWTRA